MMGNAMDRKLVTFSGYALHVDSSTIYDCWKSGDIAGVRFDGQIHFVSAGMLHDLAAEGLIHQDGICGKGWTGTQGFCNRIKGVKDRFMKAREAAFERERSMTPKERNERTRNGLLVGAVVGGTIAALVAKRNRVSMGRSANDFYQGSRR